MSLRFAARLALAVIIVGAGSPYSHADEAKNDAPALKIKVYQVADLVLPLTRLDEKATPDYESLIDLIELKLGADCWVSGGGQGTITPHESTLSLVIRQTHQGHERISDLLEQIRRTGDLAVQIQVQFLKGDLEACRGDQNRSVRGIIDSNTKNWLCETLQSRAGGTGLAAPKITFFNGQTASIQIGKSASADAVQDVCMELHGVISCDNRYVRLWANSKVEGETVRDEMLIPDGDTAVRKLPGENSWLLVTANVINSHSPEQVEMLRTAPEEPVPQRPKYLVPLDDSPDPAEITQTPAPLKEAQPFGALVKAAAIAPPEEKTLVASASGEVSEPAGETCPATLCPASSEHPVRQVACLEPTDHRGSGIFVQVDPPVTLNLDFIDNPAIAAVETEWVRSDLKAMDCQANASQSTNNCVSFFEVEPAGKATVSSPKVFSGFTIDASHNAAGVSLAAVVDVDLSESDTLPAANPTEKLKTVFAPIAPRDLPLKSLPCQTPLSGPTSIPVEVEFTPSGSLSIVPRAPRIYMSLIRPAPEVVQNFQANQGSILHVGQQPQPTPSTVQNFPQAGGAIIFLKPHSPFNAQSHGVRGNAVGSKSTPSTTNAQNVQLVTAEEPASSVDGHLAAAARELDALGLKQEAAAVRELLNAICHKAHQRVEEIDAQINKLKAERERLESLPSLPAGARLQLLGTGQ